MHSTSSCLSIEQRRVPPPNIVSSQSAASSRKYDKRNASVPPRKPPRTFQGISFASNRITSLESTICSTNEELSYRIFEYVKNRRFWLDIEPGMSLFANAFDDLSGHKVSQMSCISQERALIEEAMKHEHFSIFVRGQSGSGKSAIAERLFSKVLESHFSSAHQAVGRAAIMSLRPLMRYATSRNPISSLAELSFHFTFEGAKVSRCSISRAAISSIGEMPLIHSMVMSQLSTKEKVLYRIMGIPSSCAKLQSLECGWSLEKFRSSLTRLSISVVEVEKVLCAILLIGSLHLDSETGLINTSFNIKNAKNLVNAAHLLGVSPNMLKKVIESSSLRDQKRSGIEVASSLLLESLIDYIIDQSNSLLDETDSRGKSSPTQSDASTADSGIDIPKYTVTTIEVETKHNDPSIDGNLKQRLLLMQSLFQQSNCQSPFVVSLFSIPPSPLRPVSKTRETYPRRSILCLRTNDECEYMKPDVGVIKKQLQAVRKRIDDSPPELPMRLWVLLLALFALSVTIIAQDFEGAEEGHVADSDGESHDSEAPLEEVPEAEGDEEEVDVAGEEIENPVGASEVVPEATENDEAEIDTDIPEDADEAHVADSESEGATEVQLLANEATGEEIQINEAEAENIESENDQDDWDVSHSQKRTVTKPEWKTFDLYSGSIDVDRDCGCKIKWMKKASLLIVSFLAGSFQVYNRPKPRPKFYHFHKSVGFHNNHHHHHCRRVVPFPRRRHVHHIVRHHVHHKKPCGCLKKTVVKNIVVHHPKPRKPCHKKHRHHFINFGRFERAHK